MRNTPTILLLTLLAFTTLLLPCQAQHTLPRHRAYEWSRLSLDDLKGDIRVPVIFVGFAEAGSDNETKVSAANQKTWLTRLNTSSSANHMGQNGSVNDYFRAQSYGATNVTFETVGSYTATGKAEDYAAKNGGIARLAIASITDADWTRYDANGDGEVECVLLIYAGHADGDDNASRQVVRSIYPHQDWLQQSTGSRLLLPATGEGQKMYAQSYVWTNDLRNGSSTGVDATNTVCHELAHGIFDLPDYYHGLVSYMGQYDAMCYGSRQTLYGSATNHCCDLSAFNRMYLGWLTPYELTEPCHVKLQPLSQQPEACVIFDPQDANHFFLLENRQLLSDSWDAHLPAAGLVVTEVHFRQQHLDYHQLNIGEPKDVQIICAADAAGVAYPNASYYDFDQSRIPFGPNGRTSIPTAVSEVFAQQTVTNIRQGRDGTVEFDFMGGGASVDFTGISAPLAPSTASPRSSLYNILGQRASSPRGITIVGGRKMLTTEKR